MSRSHFVRLCGAAALLGVALALVSGLAPIAAALYDVLRLPSLAQSAFALGAQFCFLVGLLGLLVAQRTAWGRAAAALALAGGIVPIAWNALAYTGNLPPGVLSSVFLLTLVFSLPLAAGLLWAGIIALQSRLFRSLSMGPLLLGLWVELGPFAGPVVLFPLATSRWSPAPGFGWVALASVLMGLATALAWALFGGALLLYREPDAVAAPAGQAALA